MTAAGARRPGGGGGVHQPAGVGELLERDGRRHPAEQLGVGHRLVAPQVGGRPGDVAHRRRVCARGLGPLQRDRTAGDRLEVGPSYAQSLLGPTAPRSNATRLRATDITRITAAQTLGMLHSGQHHRGVGKPTGGVPRGQLRPWSSAISHDRSHRTAMSRGARTPSASTAAGRLAAISASSWSSLPPVDSIASMSAPALAHRSKLSIICSHFSPECISGGRMNSRMSLGVTRRAHTRPSRSWWRSSVRGGSRSPPRPSAAARSAAAAARTRRRARTSRATARGAGVLDHLGVFGPDLGHRLALIDIGGSVKLSSG